MGTGYASGLKLINLGWVHQSNGRSLPESRSWYRVYVLGGWEWNDTTSILLRGWQRITETSSKDDNPDISNYLGRTDVTIRWEPADKSQAVALLLRNNLSGANNRGYAQNRLGNVDKIRQRSAHAHTDYLRLWREFDRL